MGGVDSAEGVGSVGAGEGTECAHSAAAYQLQDKHMGAKKAAVVGLAHVWE